MTWEYGELTNYGQAAGMSWTWTLRFTKPDGTITEFPNQPAALVLNRFGAEGWESYSVINTTTQTSYSLTYYLRRQLNQA